VRSVLPLVVLLSACVGPPAADAELCRDLITRLCLGPRCALVDSQLVVDDTCEPTLLERTGCGADDFAFVAPSRPRVLECRLPLIRVSVSHGVQPGCDNVAETFANCPELVSFLGGTQ
jgi:hypothetical protein